MSKYIVGNNYYRVTYHDSSFKRPNIEVFVFVGANLSDSDVKNTNYFQFVDNYVENGPPSSESNKDYRVCTLSSCDSAEMLDVRELSLELEKTDKR